MSCAAIAMFSEAYSGLAGMRSSAWALASCSFVRPVRSVPNSTAAGRASPPVRTRLRDDASSGGTRVDDAVVGIPLAGGGGVDQPATLQRLGQRADHARLGQQVVGPGGARRRFRIGKFQRIDEHQVVQRHVLHGARHGTDVAGMGGLDQDEADGSLGHSGILRPPMHPFVNTAVRAARRAGDIIVRGLTSLRGRRRACRQGPERLRHRHRSQRRSGDHRDPAQGLPAPRLPRRGIRRAGQQRHHVDHRPARRHHELHPRLPDVRGVDRVPGREPHRPRRHLRPDAPGALHREPRRGGLSGEPPAARHQAAHARRRASSARASPIARTSTTSMRT